MKKIFERKYVSYLCVLLAICIKTLLYLHFFQLEGDKLFQALGAKSLIEGDGITFRHTSAVDLSTQISEPVNRWPPGYSLLLAPIYGLTGNMELACVVVDIISITFFLITLYRLLQFLQVRPFLVNMILLFQGAVFAPYIAKPTDLLAAGCLLYACFLALRLMSNPSRPAKYGLILGTVNVLPIAFRYMYLSSVVMIPAIFLWMGYRQKDRRLITAGAYTIMTTAVLLLAGLLLQKSILGSTTYMMATEKGFFPANLLMLYPFLVDAFLDINFFLQQAGQLTGLSYERLYEFLKYINLLLFIVLLYRLSAYFLRRRSLLFTRRDLFVILAAGINGFILALLGYLSLTNSSLIERPGVRFEWTFIGDGRYFVFAATLLPIIAVFWLFNKSWSGFRKYQRPLQLLFYGCLFLQFAHTTYFIVRRLDPLALKGGNVLITRPVESYLHNRIGEAKQGGWNVVLTGNDETVSNWATLNGENGILHLEDLLSADVKPKKMTMVFVLEKKKVPVDKRLSEKGFKIEKEIDELYIYSKSFEAIE